MAELEHKRLPTGTLPYIIAAPLDVMRAESNTVRRLQLVSFSFEQCVRFVALCSVCDYLEHSSQREAKVDRVLQGLNRPTLGEWVALSSLIGQLGLSVFLHEWPQVLERLQRSRYAGCIWRDFSGQRRALPPLEGLTHLRNVLAHGGIPPDEATCAKLCRQYEPILEETLCRLDFIQDLEVMRPIGWCVDGLEYLSLRGPGPSFTTKIERDAEVYSVIPSTCIVRRVSSPEEQLVLDPLFISAEASSLGSVGEPLMAYARLESRQVYYLGMRHTVALREQYPAVIDALHARGSREKGVWHGSVATAVARNSLANIALNRGIKYHPDVYEEREPYNALLSEFMYEMPTKVSGLVLVGDSGTGKTSLLCHVAATLLADDAPRVLPMLVLPSRAPVASAEGLFKQLADLVSTSCSNWREVFTLLEDEAGDTLRGGGHGVLLLVDALNEYSDPVQAMTAFDEVVQHARRVPWLRCVATIRRGAFDNVQMHLHQSGVHWPQNSRAYVREADADGRLSASIRLHGFSESEVRAAFERYRSRATAGTNVPATLSSYNELSGELRRMVMHPLLLRMLMEVFDGKRVPIDFSGAGLFERFHREHLTRSQAETAERLADACLNAGANLVPGGLVRELLTQWQAKQLDRDVIVELDPLEQLVDSGVLLRDEASSYRFAHQRYLEYLLVLAMRSSRPPLRELLDGVETQLQDPRGRLEEYAGALGTYLLERVISAPVYALSRVVERLAESGFARFFIPIAYELRQSNAIGYEELIRAVGQSDRLPVLLAGQEICRVIGDRTSEIWLLRRILEHDLEVRERIGLEIRRARVLVKLNRMTEAERILDDVGGLVAEAADHGLELEYFCEIGFQRFVAGDATQSLSAYRRAQGLLLRRGLSEDSEAFLLQRRVILNGIGCAEHNRDGNRAALACHEEALAIDQRLGNRTAVAMDLVNIADAQWGCYHLDRSLRMYRSALEMATVAHFEEARVVALIGQGAVLWSVGRHSESREHLKAGVDLARDLGYHWDHAYGLIYLSNVLATQGSFAEGVEINAAGIEMAQRINAKYIEMLGQSYLAWKREVMEPGTPAVAAEAIEAWRKAGAAELTGPQLFLQGVLVLNSMARLEFSDAHVARDLGRLVDAVRRSQPFKGPWEVLGNQLRASLRRLRPAIDELELVDLIDGLCEQKSAGMRREDAAQFMKTRGHWRVSSSGRRKP